MARFDHSLWEGKGLPMRSELALAVSASLFVSLAAPAGAIPGSLQFYEATYGNPDPNPALFAPGSGLIADLHYDASTAEGGYVDNSPTEITFLPIGDTVLVAFTCQIVGCSNEPGEEDYLFIPGGEGTGMLKLSDFSGGPVFGDIDIGNLTWDSAAAGSLYLSRCNYSDADLVERECVPKTIAQTPEPGTAALLGFALVALAWARRSRC